MIDNLAIDWAKVAKPQDDGYDSIVLTAFLTDRWKWSKLMPSADDQTIVQGNVVVRKDPYDFHSEFMCTAFEHTTEKELATLDRYLAVWPAGYLSLSKFLDEFWPKRWKDSDNHHGSCSGHQALTESQRTTNIFVTMNDPEGTAGGLYHEVGHVRLEAIGLNINDHNGLLITNPIEDLYNSPVRKDVKRPMCAVIHGLYAWLMITENDIHCAEHFDPKNACDHYLRYNIPKIKEGIEEITRFAAPTPLGEPFLESILAWAHDIVNRGDALLRVDDASRGLK